MPAPIRGAIAARLVPACRARLARYARRSFLAMDRDAGGDVLRQLRVDPASGPARSLLAAPRGATAHRRAGLRRVARVLRSPDGGSTLLDRLLYADIKTYLVELLMKQDQMSMAASIESRVPFLDHKLVEFAATLPDAWKLAA